jgi:Flp pilus assembly protein TadG
MSKAMKTRLPSSILSRVWWSAAAVIADCRGIAATEFAMIVPIMLVLFFGTYEFSSGIAIDRKVTLVARTLADLTSQTSSSVADSDLKNFFAASASILTPYSVTPIQPTISEIYVDASNVAKIQWSQAATIAVVSGAPQATLQASNRKAGDIVQLPPALVIPDTFLIWTEIGYHYVPVVTQVMSKDGVHLQDQAYSRPRQTKCIDYPAPVDPTKTCVPK